MALEQIDGQPHVVEGHGETYVNTAAAIEDAITMLRRIRDEDTTISKAIDRVRDESGRVSEEIAKATERYSVTGVALVDYADELQAAQLAADDAIESYAAAETSLAGAEQARDSAKSGDSDADLSGYDSQIAVYQQAKSDARAGWDAALQRKNTAADAAAAKINEIISDADINDSWWDDVKGFFSEALAWIGDALQAVLEFLAKVVVAIAAILAGVALLVAAVLAGPFVAVLLVVAGIGLITWVLTGGSNSFLETLFNTGDLGAAFTAGVLKTIDAMFPGIVDWLVATDLGTPEFQRHHEHPDFMRDLPMSSGDMLAALQQGNVDVDGQYGDVLSEFGLDGSNSSMITITEVVGPDGEVRYRVNIPSTQQWMPNGDGINDIGSDANAKFGTEQTQLEQAVIDAMQRAGIEPGDSVLLTGWSLGGITAANLAADSDFTSTYSVDGIVVSGSPIDDVNIDTSIPVLSFEHVGGNGSMSDPVPWLENPDGDYYGDDPNRTNIQVEPPSDAPFVPHSGDAYTKSVQDQGDTGGSQADVWSEQHLPDYFGEEESSDSYVYRRGDTEPAIN